MKQHGVVVSARDPLTLAGLTGQLSAQPHINVMSSAHLSEADVFVLAADVVTHEVMATLRQASDASAAYSILIVNRIDHAFLLGAVECRVMAILPRYAVTAENLGEAIGLASAGCAVMPPELLGSLLDQVERIQTGLLAPNGLNSSGLTVREINVLRLMADGFDTAEVAEKLAYSERTIKNVIYAMTNRLNLRNRAHAVAYAMRAGII